MRFGSNNRFGSTGFRAARYVLVLVTLLAVGLVGCDSDDCPNCPGPCESWIEGTISNGADTDVSEIPVEIKFFSPNGWHGVFYTSTDSSGFYCIDVPNGQAIVSADPSRRDRMYYSEAGITYTYDEADTLVINDETIRVDFRCGRVAITITDGASSSDLWNRIDLTNTAHWHFDSVDVSTPVEVGNAVVATFDFVVPGPYFSKADGYQNGFPFLLPDTYLPADAETLRVAAHELTSFTMDTPEPVTLAGSVTGSWQEFGLEPPTVIISSPDDSGVAYELTDENGEFNFELPAGGVFALRVKMEYQDNQCWVWRWVGGHDWESAQKYTLLPGQSQTDILDVEGGLEVAVSGDESMTRFTVVVLTEDGREVAQCSEFQDPSSTVRIPNLATGTYFVWISTDGAAIPAYYGGATFEEATPIEVTAGSITNVEVELVRGGRILGRLIAPDGTAPPRGSFRFAIHDTADEFHPLWTYEGGYCFPSGFRYDHTTGDFEAIYLEAGAYKLRAFYDLDYWFWYLDASNWDEATEIVVEDQGDTDGIVWQF